MPGSSDFEYLFGKFRWEIPAEVRILESEMKKANEVDLKKFEIEVIKNVKILQSIAKDRLKDRQQLLNIVLTDYSTISKPSNKEKFADQTKPFDSIGKFDIEENDAKYQAGVNEVEQLLKKDWIKRLLENYQIFQLLLQIKEFKKKKQRLLKQLLKKSMILSSLLKHLSYGSLLGIGAVHLYS